MATPDPYAEPLRFYRWAKRRQQRGRSVMPHPLDGRVPEGRHVEMLRLRLVEKLTLREVGERVGGITATAVQNLLLHYFGVQGIREAQARERKAEVHVSDGFIAILQDIVLQERERGRAAIVNALRRRHAGEWKRLGESKGAERRAAHVNIKRIGAFLLSVGVEP
jgi:hypothetical protein